MALVCLLKMVLNDQSWREKQPLDFEKSTRLPEKARIYIWRSVSKLGAEKRYYSNSTSGGHALPSRNLLQLKSKTQEANVVERELVKTSASRALLPLTRNRCSLIKTLKHFASNFQTLFTYRESSPASIYG
ncbi:unnamed protein product [Dovyalis caffra]|uniref:Uncharacterized protein n=1 Tax=Dovyalis caffra TaxID=77055 RepID=A0AAV1RJV8_9ROSI|nr:unnamed protein product [Dovyalis caffra]